ncbi:MAG: hypothetical protein ACRDO0_00765, partial [Nocardioidaceae bacterium]
VFPPGNAPVPDAIRAHAEHRAAWYSGLVGGFVCSDTRLTELQAALDDAGDDTSAPLGVTLTISGGAGAVGPALTWVQRDERLRLTGLEVALRDEDDLAHNAARMTTVLRDVPDDITAYVEMPRLHGTGIPAGWAAALDEVAAAGLRVKFRTGGLDHDAFPTAAELAEVIAAALDRETPFKCTAGLHHAVRHTDDRTGFEHHGFLNVLLATRALFDGRSGADAEKLLEQRDGADVGEQVRALGTDRVRSTRRWFTSLGSCSVLEPVDDLVDLGLISKG